MTAVHAVGEGPAVVWLHGYTMDSTLWSPLWELLPGWRHVGVDLPGHGGSAPIQPGSTLSDVAAHVAEVAIEHRATRVVSLSFGSCVATQLALDRPDLLTHLILAAPTLAGAPSEPGTGDRYRELAIAYRMRGVGPHLTTTWMSSPPDIFRGTEAHPAVRAAIADVVDRHSWQELSDGSMATLLRGVVHDATTLRRIAAATTVVVGQHDMPSFHQSAALLGDQVPGAVVEEVAEAGHLPLLEARDASSLVVEHALRRPAGRVDHSPGEPSRNSPTLPSAR